ncbi:helix-turn-helix protein [Desmospora activa DSM 45169]|uniref:Helix-turn-helix protein n=2 Tax=Desmospora TaxID=500614 RepID=A0A2T4ZDR2_9BACL|nr:helix-turn-helix protein [Desmospora activa DSM 45169]
MHEVGELIRKVRKERGLRLEDLADTNISPATISNIERGLPHVNTQKIDYLLTKLNVSMTDLQQMMANNQSEQEEIAHRLIAAETLIDLGYPHLAEEWVEHTPDDQHPLAVKGYHIKGRLAMERTDWKKGERWLHQALRLAKEDSDTNQIIQSHLELARFYFRLSEWSQSLHHADSGLEVHPPEEDGEIRGELLLLRALTLEVTNRRAECLQTVRQAWESGSLGSPSTQLEWYRLHGEIMRYTGLLEEAGRIAAEGLQLAHRYRDRQALFRLWALSGKIQMDQRNWLQAEISLRTALAWESVISDPKRMASIHIGLGQTYTELNRHEDARLWLHKAVEYSSSCDDPRPLAQALLALGDHYWARGDHQQAASQYQSALERSQEHQLLQLEHDALFHLVQLQEQLGDEQFAHNMRQLYELQKKMRNGS